MANPEIERSTERRFSRADIQRKIRESKAFWSSPEGKRRAAELEREKRNRPHRGIKFPELSGTCPASSWAAFDGFETPTR